MGGRRRRGNVVEWFLAGVEAARQILAQDARPRLAITRSMNAMALGGDGVWMLRKRISRLALLMRQVLITLF